ncbi:MAG: hypothetical protein IPK83_24780 [Planctomycetes bacterium]|nr:hypothetical protein [Planctomycetota bacterium]
MNASDLLVYDHLAREFAICDRWFSSVPGQTWPNRLYSVAGRGDGSRENRRLPLYNEPSFIRHLDARGVSWRWYCHDFATLRLIDGDYRLRAYRSFLFLLGKLDFETEDFLSHTATGDLAAVSWIDPNFANFGKLSYSTTIMLPHQCSSGANIGQYPLSSSCRESGLE